MASSKGLCTEVIPITHVNGVKGLLSKLIQGVLMSILVEMDTMQTSQLNQAHILVSKKSRGRGPLSARLFETWGQIHLIEFARIRGKASIMDAQGFVFFKVEINSLHFIAQ